MNEIQNKNVNILQNIQNETLTKKDAIFHVLSCDH